MLCVISGVGHVAAVSFWFKTTHLIKLSGVLIEFVRRWRRDSCTALIEE